ncbi:MAG: phospholipid phosphatase, partial [Bacteroidaceae bacterium]|nr:phospholipid phosphatase [Bacteroidaceae bacterium]
MIPLDIISYDQQATLAINGSDSLFWDNVMYTITDTFSWSLLIAMLIYILFKNTQLKGTLVILISIGL